MTTTEQQTDLKPYVVHTVGDASETIQTPGMVRQPAIVPGKGGHHQDLDGQGDRRAPRKGSAPHAS